LEVRYGGYGGIGYYHVSDKYIALFSHFIPCGVYEAVAILDGLINNLPTFSRIPCMATPRRKARPSLAWPIC
jgi:TnpA family transposase